MKNELATIIKPLSKIERVEKTAEIVEMFLGGEQNPVELFLKLKGFQDMIKEALDNDDVKRCIQDESEKNGKTYTILGVEVTNSSRKTYKYETCNDSVYNDLINRIKEREKFLKSIPETGTADPETGEVIYPPLAIESKFLKTKY
jgi:hypothetical protein